MSITLTLPDGGELLVDTAPAAGASSATDQLAPPDGVMRSGGAFRLSEAVSDIRKPFSEVLDTLGSVAKEVSRKAVELGEEFAPDEIGLSLGVKLSAEGKVMLVAAASGEATLCVEYRWKKSVG